MEITLLSDMIKALVLDNEEVSLPSLGSFVTEIVPASFSDRGYTINPPYKRLSFRERNDSDDRLARMYSEANGTNLETSKKIIAGFASGLREELVKKKVMVFPGLGRLRATKENAFFFIPDEDLEIFPYGFGLAPVSLKTHEETQADVHSAVEKLSAIVSEPERQVELQTELQSYQPLDQHVDQHVEPQTAQQADQHAGLQPELPLEQHAGQQPAQPSVESGRSGHGWKPWAIALVCAAGLAVLMFVVFIILARTAPDFIDSILYTPEQLEIIHTPL